jgi:uncharacterized protein YunC (DUF1805 family)
MLTLLDQLNYGMHLPNTVLLVQMMDHFYIVCMYVCMEFKNSGKNFCMLDTYSFTINTLTKTIQKTKTNTSIHINNVRIRINVWFGYN